ncbi:MAG: magnesium transporter CorA family protein [Armatimonadia bacterium]
MPLTLPQSCYDVQDGLVAPADGPRAPIVVYNDPTPEQREFLTTELQIDEHTLQSALDPDEMARLEFEPDHAAIILKRANRIVDEDNNQEFHVVSLGAFLFQNKLVFIHTDTLQLFGGRRPSFRCASLQGALLDVLYQTIAQFMRDIRLIHHLSETIEDHIAYSLGNRALSSMFDLQKGLVYYQTALQSNQALFAKLRMHADRIGFSREERELLDDIIVENEQCLKLVEMYSNILTGMSDARVSIISNNLNIIMKKLTVISIIFMPLNIIASMGGMSEWSTLTHKVPWSLSYGAFTAGLFVIAWVTWLLIRNIGIEERPEGVRKRRRRLRRLPSLLSAVFRH